MSTRPRTKTAGIMMAAGLAFLLVGVGVYFVGAGQAVHVSPSFGPPGTNADETAGFLCAAAGVFFLFVGFVALVTG